MKTPPTVAESVAFARRSVTQMMSAFPTRHDLQSLRATVERVLSSSGADGAEELAGPSDLAPSSLQRAAGHLGVLADEADVAAGPFDTEGGRALRRAAIGLRRVAIDHDPSVALHALRHGMLGRLEALSTFSLVVLQPSNVVANLSSLLADLRLRADHGEDRMVVAWDLRRLAEVLAVDVIPFHREGSPGAALVRSRIVIFRRSADWFQHPAHGLPQPVIAG